MNSHLKINIIISLFIFSCSENEIQLISNTLSDLPDKNYKLNLQSNSGQKLSSVKIGWEDSENDVSLINLSTENPVDQSGEITGLTPGDFLDIEVSTTKDDSTYTDTIQVFTRSVYRVTSFEYDILAVMRGNGEYNQGESYTDTDGNGEWNEEEDFVDDPNENKYHRNLIWSPTLESQFSKYYIYRANEPSALMSCDCIIDSLSSILDTTYIDSSSEVIDKSGIASFYYMVQVSAGGFTQNSFIYNYTFISPGPIQLAEGDVSTTKNDYIDISWERISDLTYFYQYEIYRAPDKGLTDITLMALIPNSSIEHFQDRNAGNGTTWYYSVSIRDISGDEIESEYILGWSTP